MYMIWINEISLKFANLIDQAGLELNRILEEKDLLVVNLTNRLGIG